MPSDLARDLAEYIARNARRCGAKCLTCSLPPQLLEVVEAERARGASYSILTAWLKTKSVMLGTNTLRNHFNSGHAK